MIYIPNITHEQPTSNDTNTIYEPNIERMIRIENTQNTNNMTNIENNQIQNNGFISCCKICRRKYCCLNCCYVSVYVLGFGILIITMLISVIYALIYPYQINTTYNNMTNIELI